MAHLFATVPQRYALCGGPILLPHQLLWGGAVIVDGGVIEAVGQAGDLGTEIPRLEVQGHMISPGLVDIHIHGASGHTFNDPTDQAFAAILAENGRRGVTSLLATTATDSIPNLEASLERAAVWMGDGPADRQPGARMWGVHVEGPYFAMAQRGAQDPAHIRNPDDGTVERLLAHGSVIRMLTYAPELPGAVELTRRLVKLGIVAAAGHSSAQEEEARPCIAAGLRHMIHMWSAQSTTVREGPWRKPGLLEVSLAYDGLTGEIIADAKHLPPTLMKLAYKCLGPDRLCAVSDATSGAGLAEGSRFRMGGMEYEVEDGVGMLLDRTAFAGSTTLLSQMLPILVQQVGIPLVEAVRMVSLTPARVVGLQEKVGSLASGKAADIVLFDQNFGVAQAFVAGRPILSLAA